MVNFPIHIASRIFNRPLLITPEKLEIILSVFDKKISGESFRSDKLQFQQSFSAKVENNVGIINIIGTLANKGSNLDVESGLTTYEAVSQYFDRMMNDVNVHTILLNVNSPGGEVSGLFELAEKIYDARDKKKIVAIANDQCCSAAYALASAASELYATFTSSVGSIGVVCTHANYEKHLENMGIQMTHVFAGKNKTLFSPYKALSEEAKETLQEEVNKLYSVFVSNVSKFRMISEEDIINTEASVFMGSDAVDKKLIDGITTFESLFNKLSSNKKRSKMDETINSVATQQTSTVLAKTEEQISLDAVASHKQKIQMVQDLCQLAGKMELFAEFISKDLSVEEVKEILLTKQKAQTLSASINSVAPVSASEESPISVECKKLAAEMSSRTQF